MKSVLVNPNVATIQTDTRFADKVYLLPVNTQYVTSIIEAERPDALMLAYGGQTSLNCGVTLEEKGILSKYSVKILGTQVEGIRRTEDRQLFKDAMQECNVDMLRSQTVTTFEQAKDAVKDLGYPIIARVAYTLGGKGGGIARNEIELHEIVTRGLNASLVGQVLIEEYVGSWKQIEYEVMRDTKDNNIIVCNMENVLSMRAHTGDNIVVAPSQTIDNSEYHMLRSTALRATAHVGIIGECNIQFALDPDTGRYAAIEVNPRLSRSSALASKATGYPLAYMSAKIGLGYALPELVNHITKSTTACFEPSLDYIVCKHPRWDFAKFELVDRKLGSAMKSVGEVMGIGRTFEESLQKAIRMLDVGLDGLVLNPNPDPKEDIEKVEHALSNPDDNILYWVARAIKMGIASSQIKKLSFIDEWFIEKIRNIVEIEKELVSSSSGDTVNVEKKLMAKAKSLGFSDKQIARSQNSSQNDVRKARQDMGIKPYVKQIDTLAAEWPAKTNYLYMTYGGDVDDIPKPSPDGGILILGAGPYRIGSSVEFDWGTVNMVWGLEKNGQKNIALVNCNPETVSTDYDICNRLYFEELTLERILDIAEFEGSGGVVTCVGGQTANNLTPKLAESGVNIMGTSAKDIDRAENRSTFSSVLDRLHIKQPEWQAFTDMDGARSFADNVSYPVIVRPSYVLSGAAMKVVWSQSGLSKYIRQATTLSPDHPVVISKFMLNSLEVDVDGVSDGKNIFIGAIVEHIDSAGVHSGDAMMCIPPWRLSSKVMETITGYTNSIISEFNVRGPFNLQFLVHDGAVYVIELNIRASRSMPFVSKLVRINLIDMAARAITGNPVPSGIAPVPKNLHGIKVPQFSFMQLDGADIALGVEMQSTGEAACFGTSFYDALSKGLTSVGYNLPTSGQVLVTIGGEKNRERLMRTVDRLIKLGYDIVATEHTAEFLLERKVKVGIVHKISEPKRTPNIADLLYKHEISFIINIPGTSTMEKYAGMLDDEYQIRRKALELGVPVLTTPELAESFVNTLDWLANNKPTLDHLLPYSENSADG